MMNPFIAVRQAASLTYKNTPFRWALLTVFALGASFQIRAGSVESMVTDLAGVWRFTFDSQDVGRKDKWYEVGTLKDQWREVRVPHTWQVKPGSERYQGVGWYSKKIDPDPLWRDNLVVLECDAIYRDASIWLDGKFVGEHTGSGFTPFSFVLDQRLKLSIPHELVIRVDNRSSSNALPYGMSFDWPADGGIIRGIRLNAVPPVHIRRAFAHGEPLLGLKHAELDFSCQIMAVGASAQGSRAEVLLFEPGGAKVGEFPLALKSTPRGEWTAKGRSTIPKPRLWHFDQPELYQALFRLWTGNTLIHQKPVSFGIRKVQVVPGRFLLNEEPMRLMGVEWMPGSDPRYGMAEDPRVARWIMEDMKRLNCVLTRFHWQQDESVLDFCDTQGMLMQEEVPTWGKHPLSGAGMELVQQQQLEEMISAHRNHPSVYAWGLCNEIDGASAEGIEFVRRGERIARHLDPHRLLTYASNTIHNDPAKDAGAFLDFVEWNEYYESWYGGSLAKITSSLDLMAKALPGKGIVISEYGLCECSQDNPVGDERRIQILWEHTEAYRKHPAVAGAIFFSYNDYRTHMGDKALGAFQQRVHGVVDLLGRPKASWQALRHECSPIRVLEIGSPASDKGITKAGAKIVTRRLEDDLPAYTLRKYVLIWTAYNDRDQPMGAGKMLLPDLAPGTQHVAEVAWPDFPGMTKVRVEVFRPNGYSVHDAELAIPRTPVQ
jgi:beta-galactosidase